MREVIVTEWLDGRVHGWAMHRTEEALKYVQVVMQSHGMPSITNIYKALITEQEYENIPVNGSQWGSTGKRPPTPIDTAPKYFTKMCYNLEAMFGGGI